MFSFSYNPFTKISISHLIYTQRPGFICPKICLNIGLVLREILILFEIKIDDFNKSINVMGNAKDYK